MHSKLFTIGIITLVVHNARAQSCSTSVCRTACDIFDATWSTCNYDYTNKGFDSLTSCLCEWDGLDTTVTDLNQCVVCNQGGLAVYDLDHYQIWTAICETYKYSGESQALSVGSIQSTAVVEAFSETILPQLESSYCGSAIHTTGTSSSTSSIPSPTTSISPTSTSSQSATTMGNAAIHHLPKLDWLYAFPLAFL